MASDSDTTILPVGEENAAPRNIDQFTPAYAAYELAAQRVREARQKVEEAQRQQTAAIAELPEHRRTDMAELEVIADRLNIVALGDALAAALNECDPYLDRMMNMPAPSVFALSLKLMIMADNPIDPDMWLSGTERDRVIADAGILSLQFAEIWLQRWRAHGGTAAASLADPTSLSIFRPEFSLSPDAAALEERQKAAGLSQSLSAEARSWHAAFFDGQMRELSDMLDAVPGALEALKAMLEVNPSRGMPTPEATAAAQRAGA